MILRINEAVNPKFYAGKANKSLGAISVFFISPLTQASLVRLEMKKANDLSLAFLAEKEGFEPPIPLGMPVFKTGAFNRSAISPLQK